VQMIDITAMQQISQSTPDERFLRLRISIDARSVSEMRNSLLLLADSVPEIVNSVTEPQIPW